MTPYQTFYDSFLNKIVEDAEFFQYNNVPVSEAQALAMTKCDIYLHEAFAELSSRCKSDVDFSDFDDTNKVLNFNTTNKENELIAYLMYEKYFEKDMAKLKKLQQYYVGNELNYFSPANERRTFMDMFKYLHNLNTQRIKEYESRDRITGAYKGLEYSC